MDGGAEASEKAAEAEEVAASIARLAYAVDNARTYKNECVMNRVYS